MEELAMDYTELQRAVEELLPADFPLSFGQLLESLMSGEQGTLRELLRTILDWLLGSVAFPAEQGVRLLLLILFSALFSNLSKAFSRESTSHMGLLIMHLLLAVYAATGFAAAFLVAEEGMESMSRFITVLLPTYCISVAVVSGSVTAAGYYQGTAFLLGLFELLARFCLLPLTQGYLILSFASCIQKKPLFERLLSLIVSLFSWIRKTLLALALALGAVQGMLYPAIDRVKRNALVQSASVIPGVGNLIGSAWETVLGAGAVLKNGIGIVGVVFLLLVTGIPLCYLAMQQLMYRVLGAVTEPVTLDMTERLLHHAGTAHKLLLQTLSLGVWLFLMLLMIMTRITQ